MWNSLTSRTSNARGSTSSDFLAHVLAPVAHEDDALKTAVALEPYDPDHVTTLHVVEKGAGATDKTPVKQSGELAVKSYATVRQVFPGADDHTAYACDVVGAIFEAADDVNVSAIAYRSRGEPYHAVSIG